MIIDFDIVKNLIPSRPLDSHKGTFGKVLIVAGSKNYPGAAILSVLSAARIGAGLITLTTDDSVYKVAVPKIPFATFLEIDKVEENINKYDSILIGPGLKIKELGLKIKDWIKTAEDKKIILDAEALNIISEMDDWWKSINTNMILNPHPGEMSRLTKLPVNEIQNNREWVIKKFSKFWNKTIILKGADSLISTPKGEVYNLNYANPLLSTAGTGDVLSGIIAGLLAQNLNLLDASLLGLYIQKTTAEILKEKYGDTGATALDFAETIPEALKLLKQKAF